MTIEKRYGIINIENERKVVKKAMKNFSFEKNKNIYIIRYKEWELCMDIEKEIIVNEKTGEIVDYETMRTTVFEDLVEAFNKGKRLNFISDRYEAPDETGKSDSYACMEVCILETISEEKEENGFFSRIHKEDKLYSLLLSNPNLRISWVYDGEIPEGFVDFCLKNNLMLNYISYKIFQSSKKIKDYPEDVRILAAEYIEEINSSELPKEHIVKILRAYKNSVLKYGSYAFDGHSALRYTLTYVGQFPELIKLINNQSSFALVANAVDKNYKLLKDKEQQEQIQKNQNKIKELENLVYEDYCFIVPTTLEELIDEGKQQNNCVGSFYNNSMARGENFIYFIRKKNEPKKSYITCRFGVYTKETVEARYKFNDVVSKEEDGRAILKASEFIKKIIETKEVRIKTIMANDLPTEGALPTWTFEF